MHECVKGCSCTRCRANRVLFAKLLGGHEVTRGELVDALNRWRWCWDCSTPKQDCDELRRENPPRKCCPDCRHRDATAARVAHLKREDTT